MAVCCSLQRCLPEWFSQGSCPLCVQVSLSLCTPARPPCGGSGMVSCLELCKMGQLTMGG